jgi:1,4-dihydroxy-2-naphthoate octaprenyltransferase
MAEPLLGARARSPSAPATATALVLHLRLHFQLLLAPIFLWGVLLSGGHLGMRTLVGFVCFHVCGYGGGTAFNSYYDRDEGPIGGLRRPPPVVPALLPFSLAMLSAGWLLTLFVGWAFTSLYTGMAILAILYAHPAVRFKARPWPALLTVIVGQGFGGFLGGWLASGEQFHHLLGLRGIGGLLTAAIITVAFYPLTQLYQLDEDRRRGDTTPAIAWGPTRCFAVAIAAFFLGAIFVALVLLVAFTPVEAGFAGALLILMALVVRIWSQRFTANTIEQNYHWVMALNTVGAFGFGAYLLVRLAIGQ